MTTKRFCQKFCVILQLKKYNNFHNAGCHSNRIDNADHYTATRHQASIRILQNYIPINILTISIIDKKQTKI